MNVSRNVYAILSLVVMFWVGCKNPKKVHNKVPKKVEVADNYLARQAEDITEENISTQDKRKKRNSKQSEEKQKDLNELNKSPYKKVRKKANTRVYDIY